MLGFLRGGTGPIASGRISWAGMAVSTAMGRTGRIRAGGGYFYGVVTPSPVTSIVTVPADRMRSPPALPK